LVCLRIVIRFALIVRDNGAGLNAKHSGKASRALQRLHNADELEGTGVILAVVQGIIRRTEDVLG